MCRPDRHPARARLRPLPAQRRPLPRTSGRTRRLRRSAWMRRATLPCQRAASPSGFRSPSVVAFGTPMARGSPRPPRWVSQPAARLSLVMAWRSAAPLEWPWACLDHWLARSASRLPLGQRAWASAKRFPSDERGLARPEYREVVAGSLVRGAPQANWRTWALGWRSPSRRRHRKRGRWRALARGREPPRPRIRAAVQLHPRSTTAGPFWSEGPGAATRRESQRAGCQ